jgi:hypothetical protein
MNIFTSIFRLGFVATINIMQLFSLTDTQKRLDSIPLEGSEFVGQNIPVKKSEREFFKDINILKRLYVIGNLEFFVTILDGTNNRDSISNPNDCFKNWDWIIQKEQTLRIKDGYANLIEISKEGQTREALIWYSDSYSRYSSSQRYRLRTLLRSLSFGYLGKEPILIVVQPLEGGKIDWDKFFEDFPQLLEI